MKKSKLLILAGLATFMVVPFMKHANEEVKQAKAYSQKDLSTILSPGGITFSYSYIGDFFFGINFSERIFNYTGYINDHLDNVKDENGDTINISDGIYVNGQSLRYWVNYTDADLTYDKTSDHGIHSFPLRNGGVFAPVALEITTSSLEFKVNTCYFPEDSIVVTFKAGIFKGFYNDTIYSLEEDLTFRSSLNPSDINSVGTNIKFFNSPNDISVNATIERIVDSGEKTSSLDGKYHRYTVFTNIPRNSIINQWYAADHYRYMYDNILVNGKSLTFYNVWARGNNKDFTSLGNPGTPNPDYSSSAPGSGTNPIYATALTLETATDQDNYVFFINVPNQFLTDRGFTEIEFSLRDGSAWWSIDDEGETAVVRYNPSLFETAILAAKNELDNYVTDLSVYRAADQATILQLIDVAEDALEEAFYESDVNSIVNQTKEAIDAIKTDAEKTEEERIAVEDGHIAAVITLIDAIPDTIVYNDSCRLAINNALEEFAGLTNNEKLRLQTENSAKYEKLMGAYSQFAALDLENYKGIATQSINTTIVVSDYPQSEQATVQSLLTEALAAIASAVDKEAVDTIVNNLNTAISSIKTSAQIAKEELNAAKVAAKAELDGIDLTKYREAQRNEVSDLVDNGKFAVDACESVNDVNSLMERLKAAIGAIKTDAQMSDDEANAALLSIKQSAIDAINAKYNELKDGEYTDQNRGELIYTRDAGIEEVNNAKTAEEVDAIKEKTLIALGNIRTVSEPEPTVEPKPEKTGCKSSVLAASALISLLSLSGAGLILLKKKKQ